MQLINHQQAQEFLHMRTSDLSEAERIALETHLDTCAECREYTVSLKKIQPKLRTAFHSRWDAIQPVNSRTGGLLIRLGREIIRIRLATFAGTLIGVMALIALVIGLNFVLSSLRARPPIELIVPTGTVTIQPTIPRATEITIPMNTPAPSDTSLPEGTIVLNYGHAFLSPDPDAEGVSWAQRLSEASGLNVVAIPGPLTDMEILQALRDGRIHMAILSALAFGYGQSQGWVVPGPVEIYNYQPSGSIIFVARTDTGLVPGEPPQVYQQLAGKQPCWPFIEKMNNPPVDEYILPAGLLAQAGVVLGEPMIGQNAGNSLDNAAGVYLRECDFAVLPILSGEQPEDFLKYLTDYMMNKGISFTGWKEQMQVLYTTPPLEPYYIMAFSTQLDASKREQLTHAILSVAPVPVSGIINGVIGWRPYDEGQAAFYDQFQTLVDASGVDIAGYLSRLWDQYLRSLVAVALTPSPVPSPTNPPSARTLTICQGAEPDNLYIYGSNMHATYNVLSAIYDGPIDSNGFSYQPVILEKLPNLADGDATIQPVAVKENDTVVNDAGEVVLLRAGEKVRPYGCNLSECAITWQGEALEIAQMSATFTLKAGIRWSDGEPLTADDSVFGYERANACRDQFDPNLVCGSLGLGGGYSLARTASYTALDGLTTRWVGLPGYFDQLYMVDFADPLPRHLMQTNTPQQFQALQERTPLGWGPYQIDRWVPGEYIQLSRNPYYFRANEGLPHFDQLTIRFLSGSEELMLDAIQHGVCDVLDQEAGQAFFGQTSSLSDLIELTASGQIKGLISTGTTWEHLDFNIQPAESILNSGAFAGWDEDGNGQGPFGDVRLRQAIAMCLDRQAVVDTVLLGQSPLLDTYLPPNHPLFNPQATHWQYDPAAAAALLDDIGWLDADNDPATPRIASGVTGVPDGTSLTMNYETTDAPIRQQITQILAQSLAGCGIQVNLNYYSVSEWFAAGPDGRLYGRLYDLGEFAWLTGVTPPCDLFLSSQVPSEANNWSGENNPGFNDPVYDAACNQQLQSLPGEAAYNQGVMEAQRIFAEQLPVVPLFLRIKTAAARADMCGYWLDPTSQSDFWNIEAFDYGGGCR